MSDSEQTVFGWDASHYDGRLTKTIMTKARSEGIEFFTHKIGEGASTSGDDAEDGPALAAARDAGITLLGGYYVVRSGSVGPQVDELLHLADRDEPWWRTFPGWFWQIDLERWPYDSVPAATGLAFARELRQRTGRVVVIYASHSQYGDQMRDWDGPLWNADYTGRAAAGFRAMYPGNDWTPAHGSWRGGWSAYSGQAPAILQYTSKATIAGLTTCDANAYRGTLAELTALLTGDDMALSDDDRRLLANCERLLTAWADGREAKGIKYSLTDPGRTLPNPFVTLGQKIDGTPTVDVDEAALATLIAEALVPHLPDGADSAAIATAVAAKLGAALLAAG